jgi:hypothetical protein
MDPKIARHYLEFGLFTNPGCYRNLLQRLPDDIRELGTLVCHQVIHRVVLQHGNTVANKDKRYGDMDRFPWHRLRCDDDVLTNAVSMIAELLRLDERGFVPDREVENKIVVTCRYVAILMASILKAKGKPCRVRSGFAPYLSGGNESWDHWINQCWDEQQGRWVTFDADGFFDDLGFDQFDMPTSKFDWPAATWLGIRNGALNPDSYVNLGGFKGIMPVLWAVFDDFHSLMNNEILYLQLPSYIAGKFDRLTERDLEEIDDLAKLLLEPDSCFDRLIQVWNSERKFRILNSPLINDMHHVQRMPSSPL